MKTFLGADHRGWALKEQIKQWLTAEGHEVADVSAPALDPNDDYPDFGAAVGRAAAADAEARGIVLCGSGIGIAVAANKISGARAGTIAIPEQVKSARAHDDINVLALSADVLDLEHAQAIIRAFLETPFSGEERCIRRLKKVEEIEHAP